MAPHRKFSKHKKTTEGRVIGQLDFFLVTSSEELLGLRGDSRLIKSNPMTELSSQVEKVQKAEEAVG